MQGGAVWVARWGNDRNIEYLCQLELLKLYNKFFYLAYILGWISLCLYIYGQKTPLRIGLSCLLILLLCSVTIYVL